MARWNHKISLPSGTKLPQTPRFNQLWKRYDLVRRRVTVIATPGNTAGAIAAKDATATIPIVFGVAEDPVNLGLVASLARPGGNATGINFFSAEVVRKRLGLLHQLVPNAVRVAVLVNPANGPIAETTSREVREAARVIGLKIQVLNASTSSEIDAAFATLARERPDALFVVGDGFFASRRAQFVTLTARDRIPAAYSDRDIVAAGGLMSYSADLLDGYRQVGVYRQYHQGHEAHGPAGRAVDQVRIRHQSANRQNARPHRPRNAVGHCR
jgi:putative ABC transport system substrate-binding protein